MFEILEIKTVKNAIGDLVKAIRKNRKLTQEELAKSIDVSVTTIKKLEKGQNFTIETLLKVLKELDLLELLNGEIAQAKAQIKNTKSLY